MMRSTCIGYLAIAVLVGSSMRLSGAILVGAPGDGRTFLPFDDPSPAQVTEFQQLFAAFNFPNASTISGLTFFCTVPLFLLEKFCPLAQGGNYVVSLSTVTADVSTFNSLIQVGSDDRVIFSGSLDGFSVPFGGSFTLNGGTFFYDPTKGNLLLDVLITGEPIPSANGLDGSAPAGVFRSTANGLFIGQGFGGLVTQFETIPEPSTLVLVTLGGLIALRRPVPFRRESRK